MKEDKLKRKIELGDPSHVSVAAEGGAEPCGDHRLGDFGEGGAST